MPVATAAAAEQTSAAVAEPADIAAPKIMIVLLKFTQASVNLFCSVTLPVLQPNALTATTLQKSLVASAEARSQICPLYR